MCDFKYRIDFYFWKCNSGFNHSQTVDHLHTYIDAERYVNEIDIDYYTEIPNDAEAILVRTVNNENDYVLSEYWWNLKN